MGYRKLLAHEWSMAAYRRVQRKQRDAMRTWLAKLQSSPPDILIGANFASFGGVRHHIEAIVRHSQLRAELVPPPGLSKILVPHAFSQTFADDFERFRPHGVKAVHSHVYPWFIDWCARRQRDGFRWVHTYHLNYYPEHADGGLEQWQSDINDSLIKTARDADVCLSVSKWQARELSDLHGINATYVPNGVDLGLSRQAKASRFRRRFRLAEDFILYVGRNDPVKNHLEFVALAQMMPQRRFVMIGGGLTSELIFRDWPAPLPRNICAIGAVSQQAVQDAIAACRMLVVTSKREGLPTLVLEAMALAKPIVVPNEAGCSEAVGAGEAGYVYELGNVSDLHAKTIDALAGPAVCEAAMRRVEKEYDWRIVAKKLDSIYNGASYGS